MTLIADPPAPACSIAGVTCFAYDEFGNVKVGLWSGDDMDKARFLSMVPEAYPHLENMADAPYPSTEWMDALSKALGAAVDNADKVAKEQEEVSKQFDEIEKQILKGKNLKPDDTSLGEDQ